MHPNNRSTKTDQLLKRAPVSVRMSNAPIALDGEENPLHEKPEIDPAICWQALHSRDRRFDGRFFAGVLTTGVYCRPICPVPAQ
jgi:hypothetical protein